MILISKLADRFQRVLIKSGISTSKSVQYGTKSDFVRSPNADCIIFGIRLSPVKTLSRKTNIQGEGFTIVSAPKHSFGKHPDGYEVVAIIDDFVEKRLKIPGMKNCSHGEVVQRVLTQGLENQIAVLAYDSANTCGTLNALISIREKKLAAGEGKYIKKVNVSITPEEAVTTFEDLSWRLRCNINDSNIVENKEKVLEFLKEREPMIYEIICAIDKLVDAGVDVYFAAGNQHKKINYIFLSKAKIVGATDANGEIAPYSPASKLVTHYAQGGYDVYKMGNNIVIDPQLGEHNIGKLSINSARFEGTSFAAPRLINDAKRSQTNN